MSEGRAIVRDRAQGDKPASREGVFEFLFF
jgi:hypothetical protein